MKQDEIKRIRGSKKQCHSRKTMRQALTITSEELTVSFITNASIKKFERTLGKYQLYKAINFNLFLY